jgi:competence protein ComEC
MANAGESTGVPAAVRVFPGRAALGWATAGWSIDWAEVLDTAAGGMRRRLVLLVPCCLCIGIGLYFALPSEPKLPAGLAALALCGAVVALLRRRERAAAFAVLLLGIALGFLAAELRTRLVATPMLDRERRGEVTGTVDTIDLLPHGVRVILSDLTMEGLPPEATPAGVRLRLIGSDTVPSAGDRIRVRATLAPVDGPAYPGGFDFRRQLFFQGIGGTGFAMGRIEQLDAADATPSPLAQLQDRIAARVRAQISGDAGAIAVAFMTGERAGISDAANQAMRDSGLAHLLSISGIHISLVAILLLGTVRLGLALVEPVALRWPIKKWAAGFALFGIVAYTILVGASVPTVRSSVMTGVVLLAVMADRVAISMRLVALAATAILLVAPEALPGPSFQMSFAAVIALIAAYEALRPLLSRWHAGGGPMRRALMYLGGIVLTTVVATVATTPFAIYHFQRFAPLAVAANLMAIPLTSILIMPAVLLAYPLMLLGLDGWVLALLGWGNQAMLWVAYTVSSWPLATFTVPAMPAWGLVAGSAGGLWLCLAAGRVRLLGLLALPAIVVAALTAPIPQVLVDTTGRLAAVQAPDGGLSFSTERSESFIRGIWLRSQATAEATAWPDDGIGVGGLLHCDPRGCVYRFGGTTIAFTRQGEAFDDDCAGADMVITPLVAPRWCRPRFGVWDRFDLRRSGTIAVDLSGPEPVVATVAESVGDRPWAPAAFRPAEVK